MVGGQWRHLLLPLQPPSADGMVVFKWMMDAAQLDRGFLFGVDRRQNRLSETGALITTGGTNDLQHGSLTSTCTANLQHLHPGEAAASVSWLAGASRGSTRSPPLGSMIRDYQLHLLSHPPCLFPPNLHPLPTELELLRLVLHHFLHSLLHPVDPSNSHPRALAT